MHLHGLHRFLMPMILLAVVGSINQSNSEDLHGSL